MENKPNDNYTLPEEVLSRLKIIDDIPKDHNQQKPSEKIQKGFVDEKKESSITKSAYSASEKKETTKQSNSKNEKTKSSLSNYQVEDRVQIISLRSKVIRVLGIFDDWKTAKPNEYSLKVAAFNYYNSEIKNRLKSINVKELKTVESGIRISALENEGINDLYELRKYTYESLMNIYGIGEKSADNIILARDVIISLENDSIINYPNPGNDYYEKLVCEIYKYKQFENFSESAYKYISKYEKPLANWSEKSVNASYRFLWALTPNKKKKQLVSSISEIHNLLTKRIMNEIAQLATEKKELYHLHKEHSIGYFESNQDNCLSLFKYEVDLASKTKSIKKNTDEEIKYEKRSDKIYIFRKIFALIIKVIRICIGVFLSTFGLLSIIVKSPAYIGIMIILTGISCFPIVYARTDAKPSVQLCIPIILLLITLGVMTV